MAETTKPKNRGGRPAIYDNAAQRAAAWRSRQKKLADVGLQIMGPGPEDKKMLNGQATVDAKNVTSTLKKRFGTYGGEDLAKRLRVNSARTASFARELHAMLTLDESDGSLVNEKAFLQRVAVFFDDLNSRFQQEQRAAKVAKIKAEADYAAKRETQLKAMVRDIFGETFDLAVVEPVALQLQQFASRDVSSEEAKRLRVDRWFFFITRTYEFRAAMKGADPAKIAREVAEVRLDVGENGRFWQDQEVGCYTAGWADFEEFRTRLTSISE